MSAGHIFWGCLTLGALILIVDCIVGNAQHYLKQRKRAKQMARFNLGAFKAVQRNWQDLT